MPHLEEIEKKYADRGVRVIVVDVSNRKELTEKTLKKASLSLQVALDTENISREKYSIIATPTTFIVDQSGKAIFKHIGFSPGMEAMLEREVQAILDYQATP